jgi:hypothetical protein
MDSLKPEMTIAEGPEGLKKVLNSFHEKALQDAGFRNQEHYILYQLKDQESLMKVDLSAHPYQCWFYDLLGRPATNAIKDTIADFIFSALNEQERQRYISRSE